MEEVDDYVESEKLVQLRARKIEILKDIYSLEKEKEEPAYIVYSIEKQIAHNDKYHKDFKDRRKDLLKHFKQIAVIGAILTVLLTATAFGISSTLILPTALLASSGTGIIAAESTIRRHFLHKRNYGYRKIKKRHMNLYDTMVYDLESFEKRIELNKKELARIEDYIYDIEHPRTSNVSFVPPDFSLMQGGNPMYDDTTVAGYQAFGLGNDLSFSDRIPEEMRFGELYDPYKERHRR